MKWTNVEFQWSDGRITTESFKNQDDVFAYLDAMEDDGVECDNYKSYNGDWCF